VPSYLPAVRYGGPIYTVHGLCRALAERGHDVHVFTTNVDGAGVSNVPVDRAVDLDGVSVRYFPAGLGRRLYRSPAMGRALKESCDSFDLLHLHSVFLWPTLAAADAARDCGVPYIVTPRGMLVRELIARKNRLLKSAWIGLFERRTLERAAAVHFTSQVEADEMQRLGLKCRRSAIIPNGVDLADASSPQSAADVAWLRSLPRPFILYLGRVNWKKGLDRLVSAMAAVDCTDLVIAGNDEEDYRRTLEALAHKLGVTKKIKFIGPVSGARKWALLRQARMLLLPSYSENFGMVVLEAMAAGCPVVVTAEVGLAAAVNASGAGLVVEGNPEKLAAAITSLESDDSRRRQMGDAGRKTAAEQFSWASVAGKMESLYGECVESRH
jgi:glycosyltransferase involved in cell wall biosynthesis